MLKTILKLLLSVFFLWALAYPFMQSNEQEVEEQTTGEQPKKVKKKEKPLHNVTLPKFSEFADVKEKKQAFFDFIRPHVEAENKKILQQRAKLEIARMMLEYNAPLQKKQQRDIVNILKAYG